MTLTDAQREQLKAITARDAMANEMWFTGPRGSFTAQAAQDRRTLLELVNTCLQMPMSFDGRRDTGVAHLPEGDVWFVDGRRISP